MRTMLMKRQAMPLAVFTAIGLSTVALQPGLARGQGVFESGSDGTDGALVLEGPLDSVVFDPNDTERWGRVLDEDGDGVYNFTTIRIFQVGNVIFRGDVINRPIVWLASGDVLINGSLILDGGSSRSFPDPSLNTNNALNRRAHITIPGSGGFAGGAGALLDGSAPATPGEGPGGGGIDLLCPSVVCGEGGRFTGNRFLVPLIGGSGGGGGLSPGNDVMVAGGAGGGAILIASSTKITVSGQILARGGESRSKIGGGGSGGAIRLAAPVLAGSGPLLVGGGLGGRGAEGGDGDDGWVRLEGFEISGRFSFSSGIDRLTRGAPVNGAPLRPVGSLRVTAIDGVAVSTTSQGLFEMPDVAIDNDGPVDVEIRASGIPPGTVVTLRVFPDTPEDTSIIFLPEAEATLQGTLESSTGTAIFTFPFGFSRGHVEATWTQ